MTKDEEIKNKSEILRELLLTEEDTLDNLEVLIDKIKIFFRIDQKTKKIVLSSEFNFLDQEIILLVLIGKYFSKELGLSDNEGMNIQELENECQIKKTTFSKPLDGLLDLGYVWIDNEQRFLVQHYRIEDIVKSLNDKYIEKTPNAKGIQLKYRFVSKRK